MKSQPRAFSKRAHGLVHGLRFVLILVDGKSPVSRISDKGAGLPNIPATLEELAHTAEQCKKLIKLLIDDQKADEFVRRSNELLFIATTTMQ